MSFIVIGALAAAAAGLSGVLAARVIARRRRRAAAPATEGEATTGASPALLQAPAPQSRPTADLPVTLGDVVQVGEATRWPRGCIWVIHDGRLHCAVLLSRDGGTDHGTVAFAPPERHILWLDPVEITLPPTPPTRLELEGHLLDRTTLFPAKLETEGSLPCELGDGAMFACYEGAVGDAAIVLDCGGTVLAFYGQRVAPGDYDNLGQVDPTSDELGSH
jgi:hypothetical protein